MQISGAEKDSLSLYSELILSAKESSDRLKANTHFLALFKKILEDDASFEYPFDELKSISRLQSADGKVRLFSWNVPIGRNELKYFAVLQYRPEPGNYDYHIMQEKDTTLQEIKNYKAGVENWPGALYLQIVEKHAPYKTYYTLIGWNGNSRLTSLKVVDVLSFNKNAEPEFGEAIFKVGKEVQSRMVFEYSATNKMILEYRPDLDMIIFDHLSPASPNLTGLYEYYGPDFSFDGLQWTGRQWLYTPDIDPDKGLKKKESYFQPKEKKEVKSKTIFQSK